MSDRDTATQVGTFVTPWTDSEDVGVVRVQTLRVVHGPVINGRFPLAVLDREPVAIGRAGEITGPLALADREVSRHHADVTRTEDGSWRLVERGSRNGTAVDGVLVTETVLQHGAVVRVGRTLLLYLDQNVATGKKLAPETPRLLGRSEAIRRLRAEIGQVAPQQVPVLILGPTGVGKELVAEEIHRQSARTGRFVAVNCAGLPETLAESELFGHVPGAFTGASQKRDGLFVAANGGTLFLDEIGEAPPSVQAKLLRALALGEVRPVGSTETIRVDVRIIAATHRDLGAEMARDGFRADLFARLSGWVQRVPTVRERLDDVLPLAAMFLSRVAPGARLSTRAAEALLRYPWPFNVRELEQAMASAAVRAAGHKIRPEHLPATIVATLGPAEPARTAAPHEVPIEMRVNPENVPSAEDLVAVLAYFAGNIGQVAEYFGKDRKQVYRWLERHGIERDNDRGGA
ncbi:MAG: sigma 54-interacting transcriptional regulator [Myxococcota bacterium]|nr:sigma 54-interacting transcriptional regulator [Myxococcota bacterium]